MQKCVPLFVAASIICASPAHAEIKLVGVVKISGNEKDKSGLTDKLQDGTPHNRLGGFGSAIAHVAGNRYVLVPDRGPKDGASHYQCRFHLADITFENNALKFDLAGTVILRDPAGQPYLGDQHNIPRRFDAEGVAVSKAGSIYIADEYGPKIIEFDMKGRQLREFPIPEHFLVANPSGNPSKEAKLGRGRAPNRGFECLTRTPAGKLVGLLQSPLMQDGSADGVNTRLLELDPKTLRTREVIYQRDSPKTGMNEILALSETEFLVLERDSSAGKKRFCKLFRINIANATDVSKMPQLPASGVPKGVNVATKVMFLDLTKFGLAFPEKVEGICFGPDFPGGQRLLLVTTDNDFTDEPTHIFAFSVDPEDLK